MRCSHCNRGEQTQSQCRQRLQQRGRGYEHQEMNGNKRVFRRQQNLEHKRHKYGRNRKHESQLNRNERTLEHERHEQYCSQKNKNLTVVKFTLKHETIEI